MILARLKGTLQSAFKFGPKTAPQTLATSATAARTATFQDKDGTVAYLSDTGAMQLVERQEVTGAAVTSIVFSSLDLAVDGTYFIRFSLKNATGSSATISLHYNGDATATNYYRQTLTADSSLSGARVNNAEFISLPASTFCSGNGHVFAPVSGDITRAVATGLSRAASTILFQNIAHAWTSTVNVTSMTFTSATASAIDIGSFIEIYRVNPQPQDLRNVKIPKGAEFKNNGASLSAVDADVVYVYCPFAGTITKAIAYGTAGGSCVFDVYKGAYGSTTSITASQAPTLTADDYMENSTLTGWTTSVAAGEWIGIKLVSSSAQIVAGCVVEIMPL